MPRVAGVYSPPAGTKGVPNTTIQSAPYNAFIDDLTQDANAARPITAGGTGATSASAARDNLAVIGVAGNYEITGLKYFSGSGLRTRSVNEGYGASYLSFWDSVGARLGYIGAGATNNAHITLTADAAGANIILSPGAGGTVNVLGGLSFGSGAAAASRDNMGLGGSATLNVGTTSGTVAAGNDSRIVNAVQTSGNQTITGAKNFTGSLQVDGAPACAVYNGAVQNQTVFPVGHTIHVNAAGGADRNQSFTIYLAAGNQNYSTTVSGTALAGTWRARGNTSGTSFIAQRVS